jgi:hypothetical protein
MTDINVLNAIEPEYVKEVVPISLYEGDMCLIDYRYEMLNCTFAVNDAEESEFVTLTLPISAYEHTDNLPN